jgi:cation diffusion facilitator family transporter
VSETDHPAGHSGLDLSSAERYQASKRVTWVSVWINLLLTVAQVTIGFIGHSQALIADGFHTLSDLVTDFMVLFALNAGRKAADAEHPYGHARIETAMTLVLGGMLVAVGIGIAANAGLKLLGGATLTIPAQITLWVAVFTLVAKELLYRYLMAVANRYDSNMLRANAWHSRSDAVSSLVVVIGIGGALIGFAYLDSIAAVVVAIMVVKVGVGLSWQALRELIDTGLPAKDLAAIRAIIMAVDGVKALHLLRTRRIGGQALVDVHIIVDESLSVSEGHYISEMVRTRLVNGVDVVADALVHIDPEDDTLATPVCDLPSRAAVLAELKEQFKDIDAAAHIEQVTLHYFGGRLRIELLLPLAVLATPAAGAELAARFRAAAARNPLIDTLDLRFH